MIFKQIDIRIDIPKINQDTIKYTYKFKTNSRHICNYLERECLKKLKYQTEGYNRVVISLVESEVRETYINSSKCLCVSLPFDRDVYDALQGVEEARQYILGKLKGGLEKAEPFLPERELSESLKNLEKQGFINKWLFKKKLERNRNLRVELHCSLDIKGFYLTLKVSRKGDEIFSKQILATDADELAYDYRFKDIVFAEDKLTITSKVSEPLLELSYEDIGL